MRAHRLEPNAYLHCEFRFLGLLASPNKGPPPALQKVKQPPKKEIEIITSSVLKYTNDPWHFHVKHVLSEYG